MFSSIEVKKNSKILWDTQKNFSEIEKIISGLVGKNFSENADVEYKLTKKLQKEKKNKTDKLKDTDLVREAKIQDAVFNPNTNQYLEAAILPSAKHWKIEQGTQNVGEVKTINHYDVIKSIPFSVQPFPNKKFESEGKKFVKISSYFFTENTAISGLNQHITNPNIFFLVSPCNGYLHQITGEFESDNDYMAVRKQYGERYLADAINHVKKTNPDISCVVLGKRELGENMEVYDPWLLVAEDKEQHIEQYYFTTEASSATTDVKVYNIDAHAHRMDLTSADLETLHQIAEKNNNKQGKGEAIIVHCQQGLDRTGMLIFAFILFQNYDYYFSEKDSVGRIYSAYKTLQWSRSPMALTKIADFVTAIYLAYALKAIDIEKKCIEELEQLIRKDIVLNKDNQELILNVKNAHSLEEKLRILECALKQPDIRPTKSEGISRPIEKQKNRPRSTSQPAELDEIPPHILKKSQSESEELHAWQGAKPDAQVEKRKPSRNSGSFFGKKSRKELPEDSVSFDPPKKPEIKNEDLLIPVVRGSSLLPIPETNVSTTFSESLVTNNIKNDNVLIKPEVELAKPVKSSLGRFALKSKKRHSENMKVPNNPLNTFWMEFNCLKNAVQLRIDTEAALQHRIKPCEMLNITFG